ncbi:unnamed protein product [Oikopleura dioica]|uniref:WH1 domain-containing protein n=1 Tax=Oikopleura dioica TaxID=34765 RepID=E4WY45_OIKDI|nr:unnamed protein product [Oikopleura dioica]
MTTARQKKVPQAHKPSSRLNQNENARVHEKLRDKQLALQTAVAQILRADGNSWARVAVGALVIVKDSKRRGYFLSLFSLLQQDSRPIWEEEIYDDMNIQLSRKFFLQFSGKDCQIGINFADEREAQVALDIIKEKAAKFKARKPTGLHVKPINESLDGNSSRSMGNLTSYTHKTSSSGGLPYGSQQSLDSGIDTSTGMKKKKGKLSKLDISGPVENSFKHLNGVRVGHDGRMQKVDNKDDEQIRRLLGEMNFVGAHQIDEMMKDETKRTMVYQFIEEKGGIDSVQRKHRAQSVKQQAPQIPSSNAPFSVRPNRPSVEAHRVVNTNYPPNQLKPPPCPPPHVDHSKPALPVRRESIHRPHKTPMRPNPQVHGSPNTQRSHGKPPPPPPGVPGRRPKPPGPPSINSKPPPSWSPPVPQNNGHDCPPPPPPGGPPPPAPQAAGGPPPPPPPSMKPGPPSSGGPPPPPPSQNSKPADTGRNALLESIQGMNVTKLRSVSESTKDPSPRASITEPSIVDQLAARLAMMRPAVGGSDDEEDSDNDSEWDD